MSLAAVVKRVAARASATTSAGAAESVLCYTQLRSMAEAPKKGGAKGAAKKAASLPFSVEKGFALRLDEFQIIKGAPKIVEQPDDQYPEWLWSIPQPLITLDELKKIGYDAMTDAQRRRYFKLMRRQLIKANNAAQSK